jgi:hypothetical protein
MIFAVLLSVSLRAEWNPPPQYDHEFPGKTEVTLLHPRDVPSACRKMFRDGGHKIAVTQQQRGCAIRYGKVCKIIAIDRPRYGTTPEAVIRHERGHCNGWHHSHPDN